MDPVSGDETIRDVWLRGGRILDAPAQQGHADRVFDAAGLVVAPGLVDLHVHLREPGGEEAETIASGTRAACRGGITTLVAMPNTNPPIDSAALVRRSIRAGEAGAGARVLPSACLTRARAGRELADLAALSAAGAVAFTDDGSTVTDEALLERAMCAARELGRPVMDHALDPHIAAGGVMHEGTCSARAGLPGIPSEAETGTVARDIRLARRTGCRVHIQHVSAGRSVDLIRDARQEGLPVSGELTPHHLLLTDADVPTHDPDFKMNPPLRSAEDRAALRQGLADGTLQALATDHAPHCAEHKARGFLRAPFGVVGLETAVGVTYTALVRDGPMSRMEWLRRWTTGPAAILGLAPPSLAAGQPADVVVMDLDAEWTVRRADFVSRSVNTCFDGRRLRGRAVAAFRGARRVWPEPLDTVREV